MSSTELLLFILAGIGVGQIVLQYSLLQRVSKLEAYTKVHADEIKLLRKEVT